MTVQRQREAAEWLFVDLRQLWQAPRRVLCIPLAGGGLPAMVAELCPDAQVDAFFLDLFHAEKAQQKLAPLKSRTAVYCQPDLPAGPYDLVLLPTDRRSEAELTRDFVQAAHQVLRDGGRLLASTNNPRDRWLEQVVARCFPKVRRECFDTGIVYVADKTGPLKKVKNYTAEFVFRDLDRLLTVVTRPGVFCHRRLDGGARALIRSLGPPEGWDTSHAGAGGRRAVVAGSAASDRVGEGDPRGAASSVQEAVRGEDGDAPGSSEEAVARSLAQYCAVPRLRAEDRVLELGCGAGAVSFAAAWRASRGHVVAVDSNVRAVQCAQWGAERNALDNIRVVLNADGRLDEFGPFDCVLTNPPYYSDYRIAEIFMATARRVLVTRGRLHVVTKSPDWFVEHGAQGFDAVEAERYGEYFVVVARQPKR